MGQAVSGDPPGPVGGHEAVGAEAHQVLAHGRLRAAESRGEFGHVERALFQGFDDAEPIGVRKRAEGRGAVLQELGVERGCL